MDFSQYSNRDQAEAGFRLILKNPNTKEPLGDEDDLSAPVAIVRGVASRTAQDNLDRIMKAATKAKGKSTEAFSMKDSHKQLVDSAMAYLIRFENVSIGEKEVGDDKALMRQVLDSTFPITQLVVDEDGLPLLDENGKQKAEMVNLPFAVQITKAAGEYENFS